MHRSPFHSFHLEHGAKMVDFAGWEMPLHYGSILGEHHQVRRGAGMFDVSHMGRVWFTGRDARRFLERILTRRISDMAQGQCRYSLVCNERGGVRDDVIIYRLEEGWMMVCNASNREKLLGHFTAVRGDLTLLIDDRTLSTAMVALQGPQVIETIGRFSQEIPALKRYHFCIKNLLLLKMTISRTGYTGEDGVEAILPANTASMALKLLMQAGGNSPKPAPAGLGCRDSLRLEAGMPLYGHELSEEGDPLSAGLGFAVSLDKDQETFIGQEALKKIVAGGSARRLVGLRLEGQRTARQNMAVLREGRTIGQVTSGCLSPTLGYPIAMAYVESGAAAIGTSLDVDLGRATSSAQVVKLPFHQSLKK